MNGHKALRRVVYVALGVAIALVILMLYWLLFPVKLVKFDGQPLTDKDTYAAGDIMTIDGGEYCNYGADVTIARKLGNEYGALLLPPLEFYSAPLVTTCFDASYQVQIPMDLPAGIWHLGFVTTYKANPVREVVIERQTNDFTVISDVPPIDVRTGRPT
jgi:hypothetical protein